MKIDNNFTGKRFISTSTLLLRDYFKFLIAFSLLIISTINCQCNNAVSGYLPLPSQCHCDFRSVVTCVNVTETRVVRKLLKSFADNGCDNLDALKLVNFGGNNLTDLDECEEDLSQRIQIQTLEIIESRNPNLTSLWNDKFCNVLSFTYSLVIRDVTGVHAWDWTNISTSLPWLQYLEIDATDLRQLPQDFASNFDQLLSLTLTNTRGQTGLVLGSRSLHCLLCKSVRLSNNSIASLPNDALSIGPSSMFHLNLGNNNISRLDDDVFANVGDVTYFRLDLGGNPFKSFEFKHFESLSRKLKNLDIRF